MSDQVSCLEKLPESVFLNKNNGIFRFMSLIEITKISITSTKIFNLVKKYVQMVRIKRRIIEGVVERKNIDDYWVAKMLTRNRLKKWIRKDRNTLSVLTHQCSRWGRICALSRLKKLYPKKFDYEGSFQEACLHQRFKIVKILYRHKPSHIRFKKLTTLPHTLSSPYNLITECYKMKRIKVANFLLEKALRSESKAEIMRTVFNSLFNFQNHVKDFDKTMRGFMNLMFPPETIQKLRIEPNYSFEFAGFLFTSHPNGEEERVEERRIKVKKTNICSTIIFENCEFAL